MRKTITLKLTATLFLLLISSFCFAQNHVKVYGNVGVGNVNISVLNTDYGTSSNKSGDFSLVIPKSDRKIGLLFSCIGYQDTLVSVAPRQDSVKIVFRMKNETYMLDAVSITDAKVKYYSKPEFVMFDFEILDDKLFILQKKIGAKKDFRILITDLLYEAIDTIILPQHIEPQNIILDCLNNCQVIGQDSVYQIIETDNNYTIAFPSEKNYYKNVMSNILFATDKYLYFNDLKSEGYISEFYRIDVEEKKKEDLFLCDDTKSYREIKQDVKFHHKYCELITLYQGSYHGPTDEEWECFIKNTWYHTKDSHLAKVADTLYFFDHLNNKIQAFDENLNLLHSCDITYVEKENFWRYTIYQDRVFERFYTIFGTTLNEIDVKTGKTIPKINTNKYLNEKIIIYKGNLYSLKKKRDSANVEVSYIEKTKLN